MTDHGPSRSHVPHAQCPRQRVEHHHTSVLGARQPGMERYRVTRRIDNYCISQIGRRIRPERKPPGAWIYSALFGRCLRPDHTLDQKSTQPPQTRQSIKGSAGISIYRLPPWSSRGRRKGEVFVSHHRLCLLSSVISMALEPYSPSGLQIEEFLRGDILIQARKSCEEQNSQSAKPKKQRTSSKVSERTC